jgi:hypothetical protein
MGTIFAYVLIYFLTNIVLTLAVNYEETEYRLRITHPGKLPFRLRNPMVEDERILALFLVVGTVTWLVFLFIDLYDVFKSMHKRITSGESIPITAVFIFVYSALHMLIEVYLTCSSIAFVCSLAVFVGGMYLAGKLLNTLVDCWI